MKKHRPLPAEAELKTVQEKLAVIESLIGERFTHRGELFDLPAGWYDKTLDNEKLHEIFTLICRWLGIKPLHITVAFAENLLTPGVFSENDDGDHILIHNRYATRAYECVAIVAHETVHYILQGRRHFHANDALANEEFVDLSTVYTGLSLLVLNGQQPHEGWLSQLVTKFRRKQQLGLGFYSPKEYGSLFFHYAQSNRTDIDHLLSMVVPWARRYIPYTFREPFHVDASYVIASQRRARIRNIKLCGVIFLMSLLTGIAVFTLHQRPVLAPQDLVEKKQTVDLLYQDYLICNQTVIKRKAILNPSDIFTQQDINAAALRCDSLLNEYNSTVDAYNAELHRLQK